MTFTELCAMITDYATEYGCSIAASIEDLEFDGPNGSFGPSAADVRNLNIHFGLEE